MAEKNVVTYTQEELDYQKDLMQKLMTCDHVIGLLQAREDAPVFIKQMQNMKSIFIGWYEEALNEKAMEMEQQAQPGKGKAEDDNEPDGSGGE